MTPQDILAIQDWFKQARRLECTCQLGQLTTKDRAVLSVSCHLIDDLVESSTPGQPLPSPVQCITFLHGFPTCSYDYYPLVRCLLASRQLRARLLLIDLLGYGDSDKAGAASRLTLQQQASVVAAVWKKIGIRATHVVAHGIGVSVAQELLCRQHRGALTTNLTKLCWLNGPVLWDQQRVPPPQERLSGSSTGWVSGKLLGESGFMDMLAGLYSKEHPPSTQVLQAAYEGLRTHCGHKVLHKLARSVKVSGVFKHVWQGGLEVAMRHDPRRSLFCWGLQDPSCGAAMTHELHRRFDKYGLRVSEHADLGHWPHLEDPPRVAQLLTSFLTEEYTPAYLPRLGRGWQLEVPGDDSAHEPSSVHRVSISHGKLQYPQNARTSMRRRSSQSLAAQLGPTGCTGASATGPNSMGVLEGRHSSSPHSMGNASRSASLTPPRPSVEGWGPRSVPKGRVGLGSGALQMSQSPTTPGRAAGEGGGASTMPAAVVTVRGFNVSSSEGAAAGGLAASQEAPAVLKISALSAVEGPAAAGTGGQAASERR